MQKCESELQTYFFVRRDLINKKMVTITMEEQLAKP